MNGKNILSYEYDREAVLIAIGLLAGVFGSGLYDLSKNIMISFGFGDDKSSLIPFISLVIYGILTIIFHRNLLRKKQNKIKGDNQ